MRCATVFVEYSETKALLASGCDNDCVGVAARAWQWHTLTAACTQIRLHLGAASNSGANNNSSAFALSRGINKIKARLTRLNDSYKSQRVAPRWSGWCQLHLACCSAGCLVACPVRH